MLKIRNIFVRKELKNAVFYIPNGFEFDLFYVRIFFKIKAQNVEIAALLRGFVRQRLIK